MNTQELQAGAIAEAKLMATPASREREVESKRSEGTGQRPAGNASQDTQPVLEGLREKATAEAARNDGSVEDARSAWPPAVIPGSIPALLLIILRRPRRHRPPRREWNLPPGCVLAVRYRSR